MQQSGILERTIQAAIILCSFLSLSGQQVGGTRYHLFVGTYTEPGKSEGIYVYEFDGDTGDLTYKSVARGVVNPSYLTLSPDKKFLYAVNESGGGKGAVSSFSFDPASRELTFLNSMSSGGNGPCYIATDKVGKFVYAGNYGGGSVSAIPVAPDGSLGTSIQSIRHSGQGPTPNQKSSHVHAAVPDPDDAFLFVPDLGADKIYIYSLNPENPNPLAPAAQPYMEVPAGSGPRHLTLHPKGGYAYVINELTGEISAFTLSKGQLQTIQTIGTLPDGYTGNKHEADAADIHISPDGKFLYASLRANFNELVLFEIAGSGRLSYRGRYSTLGKVPRNFAIDPSGKFLLVGNAGSDEIRIFKRNMDNGALTSSGKAISVGSPVCLKLVAID